MNKKTEESEKNREFEKYPTKKEKTPKEIWENNVKRGSLVYDDPNITYEDLVAENRKSPLKESEALRRANEQLASIMEQKRQKALKQTNPTTVIIVIHKSFDTEAEYDEDLNQLIIRASCEEEALLKIRYAKRHNYILNDDRSPSEILNQQTVDAFYKQNPNDRIWWLNNIGIIGEHIFSFDKEKLYNVFVDYPDNLTPEERRIFDEDTDSYWKDFFQAL